jgi:hypothetical protein
MPVRAVRQYVKSQQFCTGGFEMVDDAKLHQFMGQMLSDLGGAASVALYASATRWGCTRPCMSAAR